MKDSELDHKDVRAKAEKLVAGSKVLFMGTNGSHGGHPNVRAMVPAKVDGLQTIWFSTDLESSKIMELVKDNKATLYAYAPRTMAECRLWGTVSILDDPASRKLIWHDEFKKYFPGGADDPRLRVLRFDISNGTYSNKEGKKTEFKN